MSAIGEIPGTAAPQSPEAEIKTEGPGGVRRLIRQIRSARGVPKWILYSGIAIVLFFLILAIFAPLIAPYGFAQSSSGASTSRSRRRRRAPTSSAPRFSRRTCCHG